jgi:DASS family divalent anion:Na+ symporter
MSSISNSTATPTQVKKRVSTNLFSFLKSSPLLWIACLFIGLWLLPTPEGLTLQTWHLFIIFLCTLIGIISNTLPMGAWAIFALAICTISNTLTIKQALSTFSSNIIWLILIAFLLARGFIKTGLGSRIAYYFVLTMGKSTIGLGYGLITTEFLLAPFTPSNTARGAGMVFPIASALAKEYESDPKTGSERRIGSYLMTLCYQANVVTSAMFLTATAGNPLIVSVAQKLGIEISWTTWAIAALVPGLITLMVLPWVIYYLYPPDLKQTPEAPAFARKKLQEMGALSKNEWLMLVTFGMLLILWVFGTALNIDPTVAALLGLSLLLVTGVLTWDDILKEQNAWHTFIWLTTLLMMSNFLSEFGMMTWFSNHVKSMVSAFHWTIALGIMGLVYFYSHYAFASMTAHISSMYSAFTLVAIAAGAPTGIAILLFAAFSNLCAGITHYGTGCAPVYFGADYVSVKDWWKVGGVLSIVNILIWSTIGPIWWSILGF